MNDQEYLAFRELWLASNELRTHIELQNAPSVPIADIHYALDRLFSALSETRPHLETADPYFGMMKEENI